MTSPAHRNHFDPVEACREIAERYRRYLRTMFYFRDPDLRASFERALNGWELARGPYLEATPVYRKGRSASKVLAEILGAELDAGFARAAVGDRPLFSHQEEAICRLAAGRNVVVATGTGSGKTEAYLLPILLHLLQEQTTGDRPVGVRALILYPMNALANDQRRRLGKFHQALEEHGSPFRFTFGRYTGESPEDPRDERRKARQQLDMRFPGELVLRQEMRERPPDILLTNYSMLEYLLLRPKETPLFDDGRGATWRFLVLDEAHQYKGAKGMEIAMLLRRLKQRLRDGGQQAGFQCIATSASLGGGPSDRKALASFATELFEEPFEEEDILTGDLVPLEPVESAALSIDNEALQALADAVRKGEATRAASILGELEERAGLVAEGTDSIHGRLHAFLGRESRALQLRHLLQSPRKIRDVADELFSDAAEDVRPGLTAALIDLLVQAEDPESRSPLLSCRYHLFLRGLEGAFVRYLPQREVSLTRGSEGEDAGRCFEVALCRECGQHYLVGRRADDHLVEALRDEAEVDYKIEFYRPLEGSDNIDTDDENRRLVHLCVQCGALSRRASTPKDPSCGHDAILRLVQEEERASHEDQVRRCGRCGYRAPDPVREIVHGTDGPNAVIATTLHQLLPEARRKVLAFADGRQEAAYFAWYLEDSYESIYSRVLVLRALREISKAENAEVGLHELALEVRQLLRTERPTEPYTDREWLQKAWVHVFRELLTDQPRISLEGVGLVRWRFSLPPDLKLPESLRKPPWNCTEAHARQIVGFLLDSLRTDGAVELEPGDSIRVQWEDLGLRAKQSQMAIGGTESIKAWDGARTRRTVFLARWLERHALGLTDHERVDVAQTLLRELWQLLSTYDGQPGVLLRTRNGSRAYPRWWRVQLLRPNDPTFICQVCGRLHSESIGGLCTRYGCSGHLEAVDAEKALVGDHYRVLYRQPLPPTLRAEEHTAQLDREKAWEFQDDFEKGRIHILSCSTTFELGIDLGDLDTIFLRNAPPEPFNYAQRVGRAGRRVGHPGFAVTYCRRRPHDQAAFGNPFPLLAGKARPPTLVLTNEKIVIRHVVALALSEFFKANESRFANVEAFLGDMATPFVISDVEKLLVARRKSIEQRLDAIVPDSLKTAVGLGDGTWIERVAGKDTALERAVAEVVSDYQQVNRLQEQYVAAQDFRRAEWTRKRKATIAGEDVISFLSRKAVIPKYGFPVDVVELDVQRTGSGRASTVALERDLAIAVAEFAPSSEVVANKGVWTSRGLKRVVGKAWARFRYRRCRHCGTFETWREGENPTGPPCCEHASTGTWVDPIFGFVADPDGGGEPKGRPRRLFSSRPYFSRLAVPEEAPELVGGIAQIWKVSPGHLVVLCEGRKGRGFRICSDCGAGFDGTTTPGGHESPTGARCNGTLETVVLGHEFITDVLRVRFTREPAHVESANRYWFYHSLAYALVEGAATVLEVPRQDLNVTVRTAPAGHEIVLYDAVPGGAGLVAGLQHPDTFREVLSVAKARVEECRGCAPDASCYGCLRHYGNQFAHPKLQRGPAACFLAEVRRAW